MQNLLFWGAGIFQKHIFQIAFLDCPSKLLLGTRFSRSSDGGKRAGLTFHFQKGQGTILTSKKREKEGAGCHLKNVKHEHY